MANGCLGLLNLNRATDKAALATKKRGKTQQQKDCIDFFFYNGDTGCALGKKSPITFDEYKRLVFERAKQLNLKARAIQRIGLDESQITEINPIPLSGFVFDSSTEKAFDNGELVSSQFSVTWIFFSYSQIYIYQYVFDMISDNTWEYIEEFFYRDITSITTETRVVEKIDTDISGCLKKETTTKNDYTDEYFRITVPGNKFNYSMRSTPAIVKSIMGAKQFIREKKM